jgi:hypothetical protein
MSRLALATALLATGAVAAPATLAAQHAPAVRAAQAQPPAFRERHVALVADVDYARQRIDGTITLTLENWTTKPATRVPLLLNRLMLVRGSRQAGHAVPFTQDVVRFEDDSLRQVTLATVHLARPVAPSGRVTIDVDFGGALVGYTETGSLYVRDHVDSAFTILRTDAYAFPSIGVANDGANRQRPAVDFTYDLDLGVAAGQVVSTAGTLVSRDSSGTTRRWRYRNASPSPFLNICVAPYALLEERGIRIAYFREDSSGARRLARSVTSALGELTRWFGPLGAEARLTISEIPEGWGSQASLAGGIIQEAGAFREPGQLRALYHELSHLWNATDTDRPSPRWNEGLAMFLQLRLAAQVDHDTTTAAALARSASRVRQMLTDDTRLRTVPPIEYGRRAMTDYSYRVGQLMFAAMFELAGEATFDRIVGGYYQAHRASGGTTDDFIRYAESIGPPSLSRLFDDWMRTARWSELVGKGLGVSEIVAGYR